MCTKSQTSGCYPGNFPKCPDIRAARIYPSDLVTLQTIEQFQTLTWWAPWLTPCSGVLCPVNQTFKCIIPEYGNMRWRNSFVFEGSMPIACFEYFQKSFIYWSHTVGLKVRDMNCIKSYCNQFSVLCIGPKYNDTLYIIFPGQGWKKTVLCQWDCMTKILPIT